MGFALLAYLAWDDAKAIALYQTNRAGFGLPIRPFYDCSRRRRLRAIGGAASRVGRCSTSRETRDVPDRLRRVPRGSGFRLVVDCVCRTFDERRGGRIGLQ